MRRFEGFMTAALFGLVLVMAVPAGAQQGKQGNKGNRGSKGNKATPAARAIPAAPSSNAWQAGRVPPGRQKQLIAQQQRRARQYRHQLDQQLHLEQVHATNLQRKNRTAQYRYQQQYMQQLRQQQAGLRNNYDYLNDPGYYMAPMYRYQRSGAGMYYQTNQAGADLLGQAVNHGYQQGLQAGAADRQDGSVSSYRLSYAYQGASYGYDGKYVAQDEYKYYFRQGFSRGYQDGYASQNQYGSSLGGNSSILGTILSQVLNLQSLR